MWTVIHQFIQQIFTECLLYTQRYACGAVHSGKARQCGFCNPTLSFPYHLQINVKNFLWLVFQIKEYLYDSVIHNVTITLSQCFPEKGTQDNLIKGNYYRDKKFLSSLWFGLPAFKCWLNIIKLYSLHDAFSKYAFIYKYKYIYILQCIYSNINIVKYITFNLSKQIHVIVREVVKLKFRRM